MRSVIVSTDVFARIWAMRRDGENSEDAILHRVLGCSGKAVPESTNDRTPNLVGFRDERYGVEFPEGSEIFRTYKGTDYRAKASAGAWTLLNDGRRYRSLNELSCAIGATTENAWQNWYTNGPNGERIKLSKLRDPSKIVRRSSSATQHADLRRLLGPITDKNRHDETDWGDPVGKEFW